MMAAPGPCHLRGLQGQAKRSRCAPAPGVGFPRSGARVSSRPQSIRDAGAHRTSTCIASPSGVFVRHPSGFSALPSPSSSGSEGHHLFGSTMYQALCRHLCGAASSFHFTAVGAAQRASPGPWSVLLAAQALQQDTGVRLLLSTAVWRRACRRGREGQELSGASWTFQELSLGPGEGVGVRMPGRGERWHERHGRGCGWWTMAVGGSGGDRMGSLFLAGSRPFWWLL